MSDTICAISTALGVGAISIIRVSGDDAIDIVNKIFDKDLTKKESHTINYGHIVYKGEIIDEVMVSIMKSPKTFTKEDTIEINSHGGVAVTNKVLEILLLEGARLAEPGEFTKRAFLNGRIDLVEAESIMDLIESKTETSRKLAISGMEGKVSNLVKNIIDNLVKVNANIEVNIDYPEYEDIEIVTKEKIEEMSKYINKELTKLLNESENGKLIKDGINTLILGRPNVGKSSILNKLIEEDKAIVTSVAGTTRDIVEGQIRVNGILLNIIDTAGVRETEDIVEKIGVEKSLSLVNDADLIILVFNNNEKLTDEDKKLLEYTKEKKRIIVINKIDLPNARPDEVKKEIEDIIGIPAEDAPCISAKSGLNVEEVLERIVTDLPAPKGNENAKTTCLIFDSYYDNYKGAVAYVRVMDGKVKAGDEIRLMATNKVYTVAEVGYFVPGSYMPSKEIKAGEVGYIAASIKSLSDIRIRLSSSSF